MITARETGRMKRTILRTMMILAYLVISLSCRTVEATDTDAYEPDNTYSQAQVIVIDYKARKHNFNKLGDADYVKFYALKNQTMEIKVANQGRSRPIINLYIYGTNLIASKEGRKAGEDLVLSYKFTEDGIYYASISNAEALFGSDTNYELSVYRPTGPPPPIEISGTITNCETGSVIEDAKISVGGNWTGLSDYNGHYIMLPSEGTNTMEVSAYGYSTVKKTVKVSRVSNTFDTCLTSYGYPLPSLKVEQSGATARDLKVTIALDPGYYAYYNADWWLFYMGVDGNNNYYYGSFALDQGWGWVSWFNYTHQGPLFTLTQTPLTVTVPADGNYTFYFVVDTTMNGQWDAYDPLKMFWKSYSYKVSQ
ncbi:secreted protein [Candidatus Magnetobacterium bavaricum]|uniref:Secreted protein n=1 Tax=Candidatus Magnetobacterium bavaricum TaxID=29290 RepID=A0A0F3H2Z6_9BACT|nr:secreted protein [Candidatus Magnetobacterium bavaricum]